VTVERFSDRLARLAGSTGSHLCLGLDPTAPTLTDAERECRSLLEDCLDECVAVKPNLAFFEQYGSAGLELLERLRAEVGERRLVIADAKRGDIGSTAAAYARALFDNLGADAVTVNPLMGEDSVAPFLARPGRGVFLLARTSNPSAAEFLEQPLAGGEPLFERIVTTSLAWPAEASLGYVVGATDPASVARVRRLAPDAPLLLPGVGAQGGDLEASVSAGLDSAGGGILIAVSRGISAAESPARAAADLRRRIAAVAAVA
jgi:orotidine 5'-phosphate decarboxylase subfamily 2